MQIQPTPFYKLDHVLQLSSTARIDHARARNPVRERLGCSAPSAGAFVRKLLCRLIPEFFVKSELLRFTGVRPVMSDIYGHRDRYGDWFVKFYISSEQLIVTSCHDPEKVLTCVGGTKLGTKS